MKHAEFLEGSDANGNQTQAGAWSYGFDLAGQLTSATDGKTSLAYGYDGDGNLVSSSDGNKAVETLLWDSSFALPQLAVERDATGATVRDYLYGAGPIGLLAPQAHGQTTEGFYGTDGIGSIINLTGTSAGKKQTLASYNWGPYGQGGLTKKSAKDLGNPLGYTGQFTDPTTGLVDLRARQYDPATGRFLTPDPLGPLGAGSYDYVGDNPLAYVDPSGLHRGPSCGWNLLCHLGHAAVACGSSPLCNTFLWIGSIASDNEEVALEADAGAAADAAAAAEDAGAARTYLDLTRGGSIRNIGTNATHTEFADTLTRNGWTSRISKNGAAQIFEKDGAKYVLRRHAGSYGGWTADFTPAGSTDIVLKLRLGYSP